MKPVKFIIQCALLLLVIVCIPEIYKFIFHPEILEGKVYYGWEAVKWCVAIVTSVVLVAGFGVAIAALFTSFIIWIFSSEK